MSVSQMSAVREIHAENRVTRLQHGQIHSHVGLAARMRLYVDMLGAKELFRALDGEVLHDVDELASAVVPSAGIALGVLVRKNGAGGLKHRAIGKIFGGDQLEPRGLAPLL